MKNHAASGDYVASKYVYTYRKNKQFALFNAINLKVFFCDKEFYDLYKCFREGMRLDTLSKPGMRLMNKLVEHRFIIPQREVEKEKERFAAIRQEVLSHQTTATGYIGRIRNIRLVLTEKCNLACGYCFVRQNIQKQKKDMSLDILYKALDLMIEKNKGLDTEIHFFGGEPLLKWDLIKKAVEYMNHAVDDKLISKVHYAITTNATLITPMISRFFKENDFEVSVSIDGKKSINDLYRKDPQGKGTYEAVKKAFKILYEDNNRIGLLLTPYNHNVNRIVEIIKYFSAHWGQTGISINSPQPGPKGWNFSGKEFAEQVYNAIIFCRKKHILFESLADRVFDALNTGIPQILSCNTYSNTTGILITPEGLVSPCIVDWSMKDVLQPIDSFAENHRFKKWKYHQLDLEKKCLLCPAVNVCGGYCSLESFYAEKSRPTVSQRCLFFREFLKSAIWDNTSTCT